MHHCLSFVMKKSYHNQKNNAVGTATPEKDSCIIIVMGV